MVLVIIWEYVGKSPAIYAVISSVEAYQATASIASMSRTRQSPHAQDRRPAGIAVAQIQCHVFIRQTLGNSLCESRPTVIRIVR